jgi:hypothetical protein
VQALLLALLIGWWPTPRALYPPALRAQAGPLLGAVGVTLRPGAGAEGDDTVMERAWVGGRAGGWEAQLSLMNLGWYPTAALVALVLATPMSARRRALALGAGVLWIELYVVLRLFAGVLYADYEARVGPGTPLSGALHLLLRSSAAVLEANVVLVAVVLLAWVVLAKPGAGLDTRPLRRLLGARRAVS